MENYRIHSKGSWPSAGQGCLQKAGTQEGFKSSIWQGTHKLSRWQDKPIFVCTRQGSYLVGRKKLFYLFSWPNWKRLDSGKESYKSGVHFKIRCQAGEVKKCITGEGCISSGKYKLNLLLKARMKWVCLQYAYLQCKNAKSKMLWCAWLWYLLCLWVCSLCVLTKQNLSSAPAHCRIGWNNLWERAKSSMMRNNNNWVWQHSTLQMLINSSSLEYGPLSSLSLRLRPGQILICSACWWLGAVDIPLIHHTEMLRLFGPVQSQPHCRRLVFNLPLARKVSSSFQHQKAGPCRKSGISKAKCKHRKRQWLHGKLTDPSEDILN